MQPSRKPQCGATVLSKSTYPYSSSSSSLPPHLLRGRLLQSHTTSMQWLYEYMVATGNLCLTHLITSRLFSGRRVLGVPTTTTYDCTAAYESCPGRHCRCLSLHNLYKQDFELKLFPRRLVYSLHSHAVTRWRGWVAE